MLIHGYESRKHKPHRSATHATRTHRERSTTLSELSMSCPRALINALVTTGLNWSVPARIVSRPHRSNKCFHSFVAAESLPLGSNVRRCFRYRSKAGFMIHASCDQGIISDLINDHHKANSVLNGSTESTQSGCCSCCCLAAWMPLLSHPHCGTSHDTLCNLFLDPLPHVRNSQLLITCYPQMPGCQM